MDPKLFVSSQILTGPETNMPIKIGIFYEFKLSTDSSMVDKMR